MAQAVALRQPRRSDLVDPELSYRVVGAAFAVYNDLGPGHHERVYQRALAEALREMGLQFQEQVASPVAWNGKRIGQNFLDFLVEGKIVIELKQGYRIYRSHIQQVVSYLKAKQLSLGIIVNFGPEEVTFRRVLNINNHTNL